MNKPDQPTDVLSVSREQWEGWKKLEAENKRLREALAKYADGEWTWECRYAGIVGHICDSETVCAKNTLRNCYGHGSKIAREALKGVK